MLWVKLTSVIPKQNKTMDNRESLRWRHNERGDVSNHQRLDCLLNRLFRRRSKKTSKLRVTGPCEGNPPMTGGLPSRRAINAENVPIWWRRRVSPGAVEEFMRGICTNDRYHENKTIKDLSMMYRALWDRRHEGATRISQCTRRVAPSALTYPSSPWVIKHN